MKSFNQFYEQAAATAPAPAPAAPKAVAKPQSQSKAKPKVTDPSTGVDIDPLGRWQGDVVNVGKELEPEQKVKIKDGRKGPDPNLPSGEANPNKKKDYEIAAHDKPFSKYPPADGDDKWPGLPKDSIKDYLHPSKDPLLNIPITPFGLPPNWKAKNGKGTQIAQADNRKMPDYVRDSIKRQYKGGPDYKLEDMKNVINWQQKKKA